MKETLEFLKVMLSIIIGGVTYLLGGSDELLTLLIALIAVDFLSGFLQAYYNKQVDTNIMFWGGIKKIAIFVVIMVAVQIEKSLIGTLPLREITIMYYIFTEGLSFVENIGHFTTLPPQFIDFFETMNQEKIRKENENL